MRLLYDGLRYHPFIFTGGRGVKKGLETFETFLGKKKIFEQKMFFFFHRNTKYQTKCPKKVIFVAVLKKDLSAPTDRELVSPSNSERENVCYHLYKIKKNSLLVQTELAENR